MGLIKSDMAGTVIEFKVKVGDSVAVGQEVLILESMKMEVSLASSLKGKVLKVLKQAGDFVNEGDGLIELVP